MVTEITTRNRKKKSSQVEAGLEAIYLTWDTWSSLVKAPRRQLRTARRALDASPSSACAAGLCPGDTGSATRGGARLGKARKTLSSCHGLSGLALHFYTARCFYRGYWVSYILYGQLHSQFYVCPFCFPLFIFITRQFFKGIKKGKRKSHK